MKHILSNTEIELRLLVDRLYKELIQVYKENETFCNQIILECGGSLEDEDN